MIYYLYVITSVALIASFVANRRKTEKAFILSVKKLINILSAMLVMLMLVSFLPVQISDTELFSFLGHENTIIGVVTALGLGSFMILPGFIVFPICGILAQKGVSYTILAAFTTTMMMVGVVTYPVEKAYLGHKVAILRNMISFGIAIVVTLIIGIVFGEIG